MTPRESQAYGRNFELLMEEQHAIYRKRDRAVIYHNKVSGRFVAKGVFIPDPGGSRPDYSGTIAPGFSVHFDVKTMERADARGWRLTRDRIHQYVDLLDQARMGALAFFLVECRPMQAVFLLRVHPNIPVEDGRPEMTFEQVPTTCYAESHSFCLSVGDDGKYDWLSAIDGVWIRRADPEPVTPVERTGTRGRTPWTTDRNREIVAAYLTGRFSVENLALHYGLSRYQMLSILKQDPRVQIAKRGRRKGHAMNMPAKPVLQEVAGVHNGCLRRGIRITEDELPLAPPAVETVRK